MFGFRNDPLKSGTMGTYTFNPQTPYDVKQKIEGEVSCLVEKMEQVCETLMS